MGLERVVSALTPGFVKNAVSGWALVSIQKAARSGVSITDAETAYVPSAQAADVRDLGPYGSSIWVYTCVRKIASSLASLPTAIYRRDRDGTLVEAPDHPAQALFREVNFERSAQSYWEHVATHLLLLGVSVTAIERNRLGEPVELWPLMPQWLERTRDRRDPKRGWRWEYGQGAQKRIFYDDELAAIRYMNPADPSKAFSPLEALRVGLQADYHAQQTQLSMFVNGAKPDAVLLAPGPMDERTKHSLRSSWDKLFRGSKNAHKIAILSHGLTYQEIQRTLRDMEFLKGRQVTRDEILAAYGVPPIMAGIIDTGLGESEVTQRRMFWGDTVLQGIACLCDDTLTERFASVYPDDPPVFGRDVSSIEHIIGREQELLDRYLPLMDRGVLTANDLIDKLGWPEDMRKPWGDVWWAPMTATPVAGPEADASPVAPPAGEVGGAAALRSARAKALGSGIIAWPQKLAGAKRASSLRMTEEFARGLQPSVTALLRDLGADVTTNAESPFDLGRWQSEFAERGQPLIADLIWRAWQREDEVLRAAAKAFALPAITEDVPGLFTDSLFAQRMLTRQLQRFATSIPETVWNRTRAAIVQGIAAGESEAMLSARVEAAMSKYIASSAPTIARTEAHAAANGGTLTRWSDGGEVGTRTWSAVGDENTRDAHLAADGQTIALDGSYLVGGETLDFPGDPDGSAENIIKCRCIELPGLKDR